MGLSSPAIRDLDSLPRRVAPAVIEFIYGPLAVDPRRVGKPLQRDFEGQWTARRGSYRVLYELDDEQRTLTVTAIDRRADVYRRR